MPGFDAIQYQLATLSIANPAAGADLTVTNSATSGQWMMIVSGHATFVTSSTVATRGGCAWRFTSSLPVTGTNEYFATFAPMSLAASTIAEVLFTQSTAMSQGFQAVNSTYTFLGLLTPRVWLPPGWSWTTATTNIQAADQWSNIQFLVAYMPGATSQSTPLWQP